MRAEAFHFMCQLANFMLGAKSSAVSQRLLRLATDHLCAIGDLERTQQLEADFFHLDDEATKLSLAASCVLRFKVAAVERSVFGRRAGHPFAHEPFRVFQSDDLQRFFGNAKFARIDNKIWAFTSGAGTFRVMCIARIDWRFAVALAAPSKRPHATRIRFSAAAMSALFEMANDPKRSVQLRAEDLKASMFGGL